MGDGFLLLYPHESSMNHSIIADRTGGSVIFQANAESCGRGPKDSNLLRDLLQCELILSLMLEDGSLISPVAGLSRGPEQKGPDAAGCTCILGVPCSSWISSWNLWHVLDALIFSEHVQDSVQALFAAASFLHSVRLLRSLEPFPLQTFPKSKCIQ